MTNVGMERYDPVESENGGGMKEGVGLKLSTIC